MLICTWCGRLYSEDTDFDVCVDVHGRTDAGQYITETFYNDVCRCGSELEQAHKCKKCGEWYYAEEHNEIFCEDCIKKGYNLDNALELGAIDTEKVEINGLVATALSAEKINEILCDYIRKNLQDNEPINDFMSDYHLLDIEDFLAEKAGLI